MQAYPKRRHGFIDPVSGRAMVLVVGAAGSRLYDGTNGVEHKGCDRLADVSPETDAFYCPRCGLGGRVSGAWFTELWDAMGAEK